MIISAKIFLYFKKKGTKKAKITDKGHFVTFCRALFSFDIVLGMLSKILYLPHLEMFSTDDPSFKTDNLYFIIHIIIYKSKLK